MLTRREMASKRCPVLNFTIKLTPGMQVKDYDHKISVLLICRSLYMTHNTILSDMIVVLSVYQGNEIVFV